MEEVQDVRIVDDVETLKALSDPLRLGILQKMNSVKDHAWTAKELARELGEPQTKLYRHLKHLEETGLIFVAETRVVSGIVEQRYAAAQRRIQLSTDFITGTAASSDDGQEAAIKLVRSAFTSFERELGEALHAGRVRLDEQDESRRPLVVLSDFRLRPDRVEVYRKRLGQLIDDLEAEPEDPDGVALHVLLSMYRPDE